MAETGVHGYMAKGYIEPSDPLIREQLEWFKDQKLALMMHWGHYSQLGIFESWGLVDAASEWSRSDVDWCSGDDFKKQYIGMNRSFNPVRFQPELWADAAANNGFKYFIFTTKHHDGFAMFDTKHSDYKITAPECPFSTNPNANICKVLFDAFRKKGVKVAAYFSKSDWHHPDYWEDMGIGHKTTANPTYDVKANPQKFERFAQYVKNQILELVNDYGRIEIIWLDGGQVNASNGQDIHIEDIISEARKVQPWLISADRTVGGVCENYITPEQTVPDEPLGVPWESCITMGTGFSYRYDDTFKSVNSLIHLLVGIVAKGGNLALNVAPAPDGRIPKIALERMKAMGDWLKLNGDAIYSTRPIAPYFKDNIAFTQKNNSVYAIRLYEEGAPNRGSEFIIPISNAEAVKRVEFVASGVALDYNAVDGGLKITISPSCKMNDNADAFKILY